MSRLPRATMQTRAPAHLSHFVSKTTPARGAWFHTHAISQSTSSRRITKKEGTVMEFFENLISEEPPFPPRFADLKRRICKDPDALTRSWRGVLAELGDATKEIELRGSEMILQVPYQDIQNGLSDEQLQILTKTGVIVIKGGVPREVSGNGLIHFNLILTSGGQEALSWKHSLNEYITNNREKVTGSPPPPNEIVFYELYNSKAQILARTHPALISTQKYLLSLWHASDPHSCVSVRTPVSYFDRIRIRPPGPSVFTLGPHVDGGSIERWEDSAFRACFQTILDGDDGWRGHDSFDISPRLDANQDLYNAPNQCSIFRPWQGWTALSNTGPGEGTLRVLPMLSLATAYMILRPFFRLRPDLRRRITKPSDIPLDADAWVIDLDDPTFPGSVPGKTQAVTPETHPHLRIERSMLSIPRVEPGDQVYWHTDVIHAVERDHNGAEDSSVIYIPAVPLTERNAAYIRDQRATFMQGVPAPDFPNGEGESRFEGRGGLEDIHDLDGRRMLGFEAFNFEADIGPGERQTIAAANETLGF
ncbi:hypothetical protein BN946_scf184888.g20 [Trametes cinnabarina]|uniref:DUF1479 domain protein n=1 Tax=Pycnoporus cinnabarinus TaxID=5643 RepID=A0A060SNK2_PYCCI|nr:hypothetical protein BN946_scf184888.g20 [Trametes cinnabarina]